MPKLEDLVNKNLNRIYKKIKYLTYYSLIPLSIALFDGCKKDSLIQPITTQPTTPQTNKKPTVQILEPINNNFTITTKDTIKFKWKGVDEDGYIIKYRYGLGEVNENGLTQITYVNLTSQNYKFSVTAQDNKGEWSITPAERSFTVQVYNPPASTTGNTNSNGYVNLSVNSSLFDVYVKNEANQQPLTNTKVSGDYYGNDIFGFLAEDFSYTYLTNIYYTGGFSKADNSMATEVKLFMRAKENNKIRESKLPDLRNNPRLEFIGTVSLSDLSTFYKDHDAIFQSISLLEYIVDKTSGQTQKAFTFALEAAKFRRDIINNAANNSAIVNKVASYFGQSYDSDAYYFDIYKHKFVGVINHFVNEDKLCTLKGKVTNSNNQPIQNARVNIDILYDDTDQNGDYIIKSYKDVTKNIEALLKQGTYVVTASATNYVLQTKNLNLTAPRPPDYTFTRLDFQLTSISQPRTIILQPGPTDGKDASIISDYYNSSYHRRDLNVDSTLLFLNYTYNNGLEYDWRSLIYFNTAQIGKSANISNATLDLYYSTYWVGNNEFLGAKKIISQWDEKKVTWNTQPSTIPSYISNTLIQDASGWYRYSFNITDYVKDWVSNPSNNQGILIYVPWRNENRALNIQSSESSDVSHRPRLVIQYIQ
jgi:hypothetical protein